MKKLIIIFTLVLSYQIFSQEQQKFMFSIKPQLFGMSGAGFGLKLPSRLVIYGGIDYAHLGTAVELEDTKIESSPIYPYYPYVTRDKDKVEGSLNLYNLFVGTKFFLFEANAVQGYLTGELSKPILDGSVKVDNEESDEVEDFFDNLSLWGIKCGIGSEYFFSENFSLGGEFGFRILLASYIDEIKNNKTYTYYD